MYIDTHIHVYICTYIQENMIGGNSNKLGKAGTHKDEESLTGQA